MNQVKHVDPGKPGISLSRAPLLIKSIRLTGLFGQFNYNIDFLDAGNETQDSVGRRLTLLYGDNGSGKTTILNLLWNALSASRSGNHRSYLGNCPFASLTIRLTNDDVICVKKDDSDLQGAFTITVSGKQANVRQSYIPVGEGVFIAVGEEGGVALSEVQLEFEMRLQREYLVSRHLSPAARRRQREQLSMYHETKGDAYVDYLDAVHANPYFLADDRQIYGDDIRHALNRREAEEEGPNDTKSFLGKELGLAMRRVHHQIQRQALDGNQKGSSGTNRIYLDLLSRISQRDFSKEGGTPVEKLLERLNRVAVRTQKYSEFGLMPALRSQPFADILRDLAPERAAMAEEIISPYLEAQEARLNALEETEKLVRTLVEQVNGFLQTKRLVFHLSRGMQVVSSEGLEQELSPHQLSSGERQILLLLSNTILARGNTRLFLIDEPELSLNVKWQRRLTSALLACTEGSGMQFVVATHSVEVITGNRGSLARLISEE
ncbi:AAA family ATPase [Streptomyces sp. NBC_00069]|uniref:AAA family ATPase n=1 Tax=Streptomyces sp. NBC_00069 TaxID=2975639 RepID=UPI0032544357|nr:AAA family ATPase [Streptomyces sp. NBC_00998]